MEGKRDWKREKLAYAVGAMLYCPALNRDVVSHILERKFEAPYSMTLCLEDSIADSAVEEAEEQLFRSLHALREGIGPEYSDRELPLIFIRVRSTEQLRRIGRRAAEYSQVVAGYTFPKFSTDCADEYIGLLEEWNRFADRRLYMMPILESEDMVNLCTRYDVLYECKRKLDQVREMVLNVRVGGNDFCKRFGVRRHCTETIYDIRIVSQIIMDISTIFSREYVVSGPVWEYFSGEDGLWSQGLLRETRLDMLNGLVGKTVIHPNQISVVNQCLRVSRKDYNDAAAIAGWQDGNMGVSKSGSGERMNEKKTHDVWADKVLTLAELYGVNEDA